MLSFDGELFNNIKILGLNINDIIIIFFMLISISILILKGKNNILIIFLGLYVVYLIFVGVDNGVNTFDILYSFRTFLYLWAGYLIFRNINIYYIELTKIFILSGVITSIITIIFNGRSGGNLYLILIALWLVSEKDIKNIYKFLILMLGIAAILLSTQRTIIIPLIIILMRFIKINFNKSIKNKLIVLPMLICIVFYLENKYFLISNLAIKFTPEKLFGVESTLNFRINSIFMNFNSIINLFCGHGLGAKVAYYSNVNTIAIGYDLEMLLPNYIHKYGIIGSFIMFIYFIKNIRLNYDFKYEILKCLIVILIGGMISGLSLYSGQLILGILIGVLSNKIMKERWKIE